MRTVYSGLLAFASLGDGIAEGDGFFFFGFGLVVGANILQLFQLFQQALIKPDGKNGRYFFSFLVSDEGSGGHTMRIYRLMNDEDYRAKTFLALVDCRKASSRANTCARSSEPSC